MRRGRVQSVIVVLATTVAVAAVVSVDGGVWRRIQRAFVGEQTDQAPEWLEPAPGTSAVPQPVRFRWTSVRGAVAYRLHVGTAPGRQNLVSTGRIQSKSYTTPQLPGGRPLYARVSARRDGAWHHADLRFTARRLAATWIHPRPGQPDVEPARLFEWTPVPEADTYHLTVGTRPGLSDVIDLPLRGTTQIRLEGLPVGRRLAARLRTRVGGEWYARDIDFAIRLGYEAARPLHPSGKVVDLRRPFIWTAPPMASGYRLRIGSSPGGSELHDSGEIDVTRRFVAALPEGQRLHATLTTMYLNRSVDHPFEFYARPGHPNEAVLVEAALAATAAVRDMAGPTDHPWPRSLLGRIVRKRGHGGCVEYADALLQALSQQGLRLRARPLNVCLLGNLYDCHTLVEMLRPGRHEWMLLDPTFAVTARRRSDGEWATAADLVVATREEDWSDVSFVPLSEQSLPLLNSYYIDYPLLFVSAFGHAPPSLDDGPPILRYYEEVALPLRDQPGAYAIQCTKGPTVTVLINGSPVRVTCGGRDNLSHIRTASSLFPLPGHESEVRVFRPRRFVF